jgi:hypothetical protein
VEGSRKAPTGLFSEIKKSVCIKWAPFLGHPPDHGVMIFQAVLVEISARVMPNQLKTYNPLKLFIILLF